MSKIDFVVPPVLPRELAPRQLASSDTLIKNRRQVEVKPQQSNVINLYPSPNQRTEFVLNAPNGFMDNSKSHLEFKVNFALCEHADTFASGVDVATRSLCTGGGHAMIRNITITDGSGVILSETPQYAKLYALLSNYSDSKEYVDTVGVYAGDSVHAFDESYSGSLNQENMKMLTSANGFSGDSLALAPYILTMAAGNNILNEVAVGDYIRILAASQVTTTDTSFSYDLIVSAYDSTTITFAAAAPWSALPGTLLAATDIVGIFRLSRKASTRKYVANVNGKHDVTTGTLQTSALTVKLQLKLLNSFLQQDEYIPLRYLRNLRITIDWNPAWMTMMSGKPATTTNKFIGALISEPRYIMSIVEPVESVLEDWDRRYASDLGLVYHYPDFYNHIRYCSVNDTSTLQYVVPAVFVSTRAAINAFYLDSQMAQGSLSTAFVASTDVQAWYGIDKTGITSAAHISEYEYVVGSDRYPLDGRVALDILGGENLLHNLKTLQKSGEKNLQLRFSPIDLRGIHPSSVDKEVGYSLGVGTVTPNASKKTIFSADFTKAGELSGISLRTQDLQPVFYRNSAADSAWGGLWPATVPLHLFTWLIMDKVLKISANDSGARVFS